MDWLTDAWAWLGHEVMHFGLRWLVVIVLGLIFGGFFGKRYRDMKARIDNLRADLDTLQAGPDAGYVVVVENGGTYTHSEGDTHIHHHISGKAEIREPKAGRVIPLHVEFPEAGITGEWQPDLERVPKLIKGDHQAVSDNPGHGWRVQRLIINAETSEEVESLRRDFDAAPHRTCKVEVLAAYWLKRSRLEGDSEEHWWDIYRDFGDEAVEIHDEVMLEIDRLEREYPAP